MAERIVRVQVIREILAVETGHWCDDCQTPSAVRLWVSFRFGDKMHLQDAYGCTDCHSRNVTLGEFPQFRSPHDTDDGGY